MVRTKVNNIRAWSWTRTKSSSHLQFGGLQGHGLRVKRSKFRDLGDCPEQGTSFSARSQNLRTEELGQLQMPKAEKKRSRQGGGRAGFCSEMFLSRTQLLHAALFPSPSRVAGRGGPAGSGIRSWAGIAPLITTPAPARDFRTLWPTGWRKELQKVPRAPGTQACTQPHKALRHSSSQAHCPRAVA